MKTLRDYAEEYDEPKKRKPYACFDGMCGATDCAKCGQPEGERGPRGDDEQEDEE